MFIKISSYSFTAKSLMLISTFVALVGFFAFFNRLGFSASIKDTDVDGISDEAEINTYKTDPDEYDTDKDGVGDGQEIVDKTNPLDKNSSPLITEEELNENQKDAKFFSNPERLPWYLARSSGIAAYLIMTLAVIFGMGMSSKSFYNFLRPPNALETHRTITWLGLIATVSHFILLMFDQYMKLRPIEALVPFLVVRDFKSGLGYDLNLAVSFGVIALYLMVLLIVTSEFRSKMSLKLWRKIHYSSFFAYILFTIHGFTAGTDSKEWWMELIYKISVMLVLTMLAVRLKSVLDLIKKRQALKNLSQNISTEGGGSSGSK